MNESHTNNLWKTKTNHKISKEIHKETRKTLMLQGGQIKSKPVTELSLNLIKNRQRDSIFQSF